MGKTPKPLSILVHASLKDRPEILELAAKGHMIRDTAGPVDAFDLVLGPNCWRMDESLLAYLDMAIKGARAVKYPKKERSEATNEVREPSVGGEK